MEIKQYYSLIVFLCLLPFILKGDTAPLNNSPLSKPITFSGWIMQSVFCDTRQVIADHEGYGLYFPSPYLPDKAGKDINAHGQTMLLPTFSRLEITLTGPPIKMVNCWGYIEMDFLGKNPSTAILDMRHAFLQLDFKNDMRIRAGQYWHPLYVAEADAGTLSITVGWPFQCTERAPQIYFLWNKKYIELKCSAVMQLDRTSLGPLGPSSTYLRNAAIPNLDIQGKIHYGNHFGGMCYDWKRIRPRLSSISPLTGNSTAVNESINSSCFATYLSLHYRHWYLNTKFLYSENFSEGRQLSGYAVREEDPITGERTYTNIRCWTWWADIVITKHDNLRPGIFIGYTKNKGAAHTLFRDSNNNPIIYSLSPTLDYVARLAPRIRYFIKKLEVAAEIEYTVAAYGTIDSKGSICDAKHIGNTRFHLALFYHF